MKVKPFVVYFSVAVLLVLAGCVPIPPPTATPAADPAGLTSTAVRGGANPTETPVPACPLDIVKDATAFRVEAQRWVIAKMSQPITLTLEPGGTGQVDYTVTLDADDPPVENALVVTGTITITNASATSAQIVDIVDVLAPEPAITATVACEAELPFTLPAGETLLCAYAAQLPDESDRVNTVTVTLAEPAADRGAEPEPESPVCAATAQVRFAGEQTLAIDQCVEVDDSFSGALGTACATEELPKRFVYSRPIGPLALCGTQAITNTATFTAADTFNTGLTTHTLTVDTPCVGCVSGQGYWKNHADKEAKQYDKTWDLVGAQGSGTIFYKSNKTWLELLETSANESNGYYILGYQYVAAKLNVLKGAGVTKNVSEAIAAAEAYFLEYPPLPAPTQEQWTALESYKDILDDYNNGNAGTVSCDE